MFGFEWHNQRGVEGTGFVRALRSRLTAHLPILMPELQRIVETAIADELVAPGSDVTRQHYAVRTLFRYLKPIVEKRLAARANSPRSLQEDAPVGLSPG
ncbi:hypothetical protein ACP6JD_004039 [Aspergillus fumigatus]